MANWLDKYAMGGALPGATGMMYARTQDPAPSNGKYAKKTKASAQDGMTLPDAVVVGGRDKKTVDLYKKEIEKLKISENNPYFGRDEFADHYAKMQMAKEFGVPKVRPAKPISAITSFIRNRSGVKSDSTTPHPTYDPLTKTIKANFDDYKGQYIPELSHYLSQTQRKELLGEDKGYIKGNISNIWEYIKGGNPYEVEGTEENFAHSQIQPAITDEYIRYRKEGRKMFTESARNSMKRKAYEKNKKLQNGSVIKDDRGQLAYPGEITEIGSNDITMQGVDYPVLGVSDTGDTQMMYPDQDYKFNGEKVTEYPMAQNGDWLSKYDNISNTNSLKKEAEERLSTMGKPKSTISQYTPKPGEQAKFDKQKLERIAEDNAPLNRMAASKGAENMQDAIEAALIMEGGMFAGKLIGKGAKAAAKQTGRIYNKVATGESALPIAWKSPAKGLSQEASDSMFKGIANTNKLSDADRALLLEYQYDSKPFTGRWNKLNESKRQALNNIIKNNELNINNNAILTRKFSPNNQSLGAEFINGRLNLGDRPSSFSAGIGVPSYGSGAVDRLVVPNRYTKQMGNNLLANEYGIPSDKTFDLISGSVKDFAAARGVMADDLINAEREVIGTGLDFKRIGKVKNDIGGYDHIVRPKSSIDNVGTELESKISKLKQQEVLAEESRKNLWADYKAGKITGEEYTIGAKKLNPTPFDNPRYTLEKQLREHKVKQEIVNTPQQNILKSEEQLGKNISDGGTNNKGVFELGDNHVARLSTHGYDDASRLVNYADKIKSPRIAKTVQVKEIDGKVYQVQEKVQGTPITKLSKEDYNNIPKQHIDNFWKDKTELDKLGLSIDISGGKSNVFYNKNKGFQFIDLGIGKNESNKVISETLKLPKSNSGWLEKYK